MNVLKYILKVCEHVKPTVQVTAQELGGGGSGREEGGGEKEEKGGEKEEEGGEKAAEHNYKLLERFIQVLFDFLFLYFTKFCFRRHKLYNIQAANEAPFTAQNLIIDQN